MAAVVGQLLEIRACCHRIEVLLNPPDMVVEDVN